MNPKSAKLRFAAREVINFSIVFGIFAVSALLFSMLSVAWAWGADFFVIVILLFFYFIFLEKRPISIRCPHCSKHLDTNTPWICGNKGCRNDQADEFPFINKCQHCGYSTKAYECHHCGELIFFTNDEQRFNYSKCVNVVPKSEPVKKDETLEAASGLKKGIYVKQLKIEEAKLDIEHKRLKSELEPPKRRTAFEELEEYYKGMMGNEDAAKKWHAAIDAEFPNDPDEREKRHRVVEQWMMNRL